MFKVTFKDFVIFAIFCVFLFYICAIGVLNFSSFSSTGNFVGLNPFPAFSREYFPVTIMIFAVVLIIIFTSVSSYIFNRDKSSKGIGLSFGEKDEKGYSRWATEKEIKKSPHVEKVYIRDPNPTKAAGVPLINNGREMYVDDGENHTLVIGATASGKTTAVVYPLIFSLAKKGESMVVTDPKGEIYKDYCNLLKNKGYKVIVLNFRDPANGSAWNPLMLPYRLYKEGNIDKSTELLEDIALNILIDPKNQSDPFWEKNAADYFSGIALGLFEDATDESQINLNSIGYMANVGEEKFAASQYIKEYFNLKGEKSSAYTFASSVINAPSETKGGVVSVFRQKIRLFSSRENLSEMLSYSDIEMRNIGHEKTAVFIIIHDEKTTYHALATIFIKQCYETLIDSAYKEKNGKLPFKTNFILDEFANMPPLKDVTAMVTAARSRAIRFTFIIQNFAQLDDVYGKEDSQTIRSNCGNLIYLITTELAALEEISKLCGEVKSKEKDKTASTPLISVADLQKLKMNEVIIIRARMNPFRTKLKASYEIDWGEKFDEADFYSREIREIKLFDLKEFVKEKKRSKLFEALDNGEGEVGNTELEKTPFASFPNPSKMPGSKPPAFDFNDLAKKIDAKIAAMEEEEKKKKLNQNIVDELPKVTTEENKPKVEEIKKAEPQIIDFKDNFESKKEDLSLEETKPVEVENTVPATKINVDKDSVVVSEDVVSDDEFFDDFFNDD